MNVGILPVTCPPVTIEVREYDPSWPELAASVCAEVDAALPGVFLAIEHIGSTSVPGLAAKPIIDIMAAVTSLEQVASREAALAALGFERFETGMSDRLFYRRPVTEPRTHHLHVVTTDTWNTRNERILRDYLLAHPDAAERYGALKKTLADDVDDPDTYTRAKTDLIQELVDAARAERGLPSVPVWEA